MRLLVSVRSVAEAAAVMEGGADIVDAKDPARGALGALAAARLAEVIAAVPPAIPFSAALGDVRSATVAARRVKAIPARPAGEVWVKLGFLGAADADVEPVLRAAHGAAVAHPARPAVVAVAYADAAVAGAPSPEIVLWAAERAGVAGVLLDTALKRGPSLTHLLDDARLRAWIDRVRASGLLAAVAGRLSVQDVSRVAALGADVLGVRGAACLGGRRGQVDAGRVAALRDAIATQVCD